MKVFLLNIPDNANTLMIRDITAFARDTGLSSRAVGRRAIGHHDLINHLSDGQTITIKRAIKLYTFMNNYKKDTKNGSN